LDFNQREITLSVTATISFEIIRFCGISTREIAETPEVFSSIEVRSSAVYVACLIKVEILIEEAGEITIFLVVDCVVYERINTLR
jgi:hypothetical protein